MQWLTDVIKEKPTNQKLQQKSEFKTKHLMLRIENLLQSWKSYTNAVSDAGDI